jgi:signal transduction histidine kinase
MRFDPLAKLRHLLQVMAFCLAIATIQYAFAPERPYAPLVAYSLAIGLVTWAVIDLGRHYFPSARETGWPSAVPGLLLVLGGIAAGYLLGTSLADGLCRTFGWYAGQPQIDRASELRTSLLITLLAGIAGTFYFYSSGKSRYLERKMDEARRHANDARLKLLETQLEPHMLFNTLANLRALIGADPARAQEMLDHMIAYLRATLGASRAATHPLQTEIDRLRDYLALMAIRMGPRLQYRIELPPQLADVPVPTLLLQPLVENSLQHGLEPKVEGGRIDVAAGAENAMLVLRVCDTGVGVAADDAGRGFGLTQVRERLATLYGEAAQLRFASRPGEGAMAEVRLPLNA